MPKAKAMLTVVVENGSYNMFAPIDNHKSQFLAALLKVQGGVSDTVADGVYNYYIKKWTLQGPMVVLEPKTTE